LICCRGSRESETEQGFQILVPGRVRLKRSMRAVKPRLPDRETPTQQF
jgi:hypothetical protein